MSGATIITNSNYYGNEVIVPNLSDNTQEFRRSPKRAQRKRLGKRKTRTRFSQIQKNALESSFTESMYPSRKVQLALAEILDLDHKPVQIWFQNRRARFRKLNKSREKVKLGENTDDANQNVIHQYDGYCPTCLLPVHYRCYQDGRWLYSRPPYIDYTNYQAGLDQSQTLYNNNNNHQSTHNVYTNYQAGIDESQPLYNNNNNNHQTTHEIEDKVENKVDNTVVEKLDNTIDDKVYDKVDNKVDDKEYDRIDEKMNEKTDDDKQEEGYQSEDFDDVLNSVELLCR